MGDNGPPAVPLAPQVFIDTSSGPSFGPPFAVTMLSPLLVLGVSIAIQSWLSKASPPPD